MADIVLVGGGVVGLGTAMLLAAEGHEVTVLERDAAPPPRDPQDAWASWERRGVNQFRLPHFFLARYRSILDAELPAVAQAIEAAGGLRYNPLLEIPEHLRGPERPEDGDVELLTGRRPVVESAVSAVAEETAHLTVRRGVPVEGLLTAPDRRGVPHVTGVRTESGEGITADLVVDMTGRRSPLARWLADAGARPPLEELEDSGFIYYARHYRSPEGSRPFALGPGLMHLGTISTITLPADNGTWSVVITASAADKSLYGLRDAGRWEKLVRALPLVAHWLDGEPIDERIVTMTKIEDRRRSVVVDGEPVATGIVAVADAWACSNPSVGRGTSIGMLHGLVLRDTLRETSPDDPHEFATAFADATTREVSPWFEWTREGDRHRLAEIDHAIRGEAYEPRDSAWELEKAFTSASSKDPDCLRQHIRAAMVVERLDLSPTGDRETKLLGLGGNWRDEPVPAPPRDELVALANE